MSGDWFEIARILIALLTTGSVVKLMDDALDTEFDLCLGKRTLAAKMGRATLPYCLVLVLIGAAANLHVSISIFLASYAVGMFHHLDERLPTRLPAYVECLGAFLLSALLTGWIATLWALCMMCVIDWLDDVVDSVQDKESGQSNMTVRFGVAEVLFGILLVLFGAIWLEAWWTAYAFVTLAILTIFFELTTTQILET